MQKISAVVNTYNAQKHLVRALASLKGFANEVIVVDMMSTDDTVTIAKEFGAKVFKHKKVGFVEPARNFAISKAKYEWVFILDADEEIPLTLKKFFKDEIKEPKANYYRIPRRNIIFDKWIRHTGWWPDYNIRFFKKGTVSWNEMIHSVPITTGVGVDLPPEKDFAIRHNAYSSIDEYILRMNRYTTIQARELNRKEISFTWTNILTKPVAEFLRRYFVSEGYKDGLHGLALSLLQAFSELVLYLKLWQKQKFTKQKLELKEIYTQFNKISKDIDWWKLEVEINKANFFKKIWLKTIRKIKLR